MLPVLSILLLILSQSVDARSKVGTTCPGGCKTAISGAWHGPFRSNMVAEFEAYILQIKRIGRFMVAAGRRPLLFFDVRPLRSQIVVRYLVGNKMKTWKIKTHSGFIGKGKYINLRLIKYGRKIKVHLNKEPWIVTDRFGDESINVFAWGGLARANFTRTFLSGQCMTTSPPCGTTGRLRDVPGSYCLTYTRNKIVGGINARVGAHPWQIAIRDKRNIRGSHPHKCGGILIHSCWVLTAAHCFGTLNPEKKFVIRVGDYSNVDEKKFNRFENPQDIDIEKIIKHKDYTTGLTTRNDIALVKLKGRSGTCAVLGEFVKPACLPTQEINFGTERKTCVISGWGATESDQDVRDYPKCLQSANVKLINNTDCEVHYPRRIYDEMVCAEGTTENGRQSDACQGDSGGPLVCEFQNKHYAWGITSWGEGCGSKPGVYTKIIQRRDWIEDQLADECIRDTLG